MQLGSLLELLLLSAKETGVDSLVDNLDEELWTLFRSVQDEELTLAPYSLRSPVRLFKRDGDVSYKVDMKYR